MSVRSSLQRSGFGAFIAALASALLGGCGREPNHNAGRRGDPVRVAAAADLAVAFTEVGAAFERASGKKVAFTFGSTGLLAKQISEGAPFDVFAAANISYVDEVVRAKACNPDTQRLYARGRIVLWSKYKEQLPTKLSDLTNAKYAKVAIANPDHAPYGVAAKEALTNSGVWLSVEPRTVYGENVQQTMMFAQSGNAEVAVVALSLALTSGGSYALIDPELHAPLDQAMVVCSGGSGGGKPNEARSFVEFVSSDAGRTLMRKYGFLLPGETLPSSK